MFSDHPGIRRRVSNLTSCTTARSNWPRFGCGRPQLHRRCAQRAGSSLVVQLQSSCRQAWPPAPSPGTEPPCPALEGRLFTTRTTGEAPKQQTLNNIKKLQKEIRKYFKLTENSSTTHQSLWDEAKLWLRLHKCMYIRKYVILKIRIFKKERIVSNQ